MFSQKGRKTGLMLKRILWIFIVVFVWPLHGGTNFFLHLRKAFYATEQTDISTSLFQTERFDGLYRCSNSLLDFVNGLFCIWKSSFMRGTAIFNPIEEK
ncbi:hypothetical protein H5410_041419 [Solanum commersonii]|uniref:Uncharacterized protein n=1 Tax=Solanum commersonii TaxID=4109 RepID=A0A9J5XRT6_SOLCO|nr:hypothetical protein H5410_041419 [Solanum commersonii]